MLRLLVLFLYLSSARPDKDGNVKSQNLCILPPQPKHGRYTVIGPEIPNLSPGQRLSTFTIEVTCDPGFAHPDHKIFACFEDGSTVGVNECLPECKRQKNNFNVMSCGIGSSGVESRCVEPSSDSLITRYKPHDEEDCGRPGFAQTSVIAGGRSATQQELPWHAGIYTKKKKPYMQICGGSLVSQTVVISAAHCFWSEKDKQLPAADYAVAVGKLYRPWSNSHDDNAQKSDVAEIKLPPRFQGSATNLQDDIALVIVSSPFSFVHGVRPICLGFNVVSDRQQLEDGNLGTVGGWGLTGEEGRPSQVLKVVELPVVAIDQCLSKSDPSFTAHITSDKICAGYQNGTAVCKGDSGGGLSFAQLTEAGPRYFLRGVVSGAPASDHLCNTLAWATFTHVLKHEHFIRKTVPEKNAAEKKSEVLASLPLQISQLLSQKPDH